MKVLIGILVAAMLIVCVIMITTGTGGSLTTVLCLLGLAVTVLGALFGGKGKKQDNDNNDGNNDSNNSNN